MKMNKLFLITFFAFFLSKENAFAKNTFLKYQAKINLYFNPECKGDTVYMELNSFIPSDEELQPKQVYTAILDKNGHASVSLDLKRKYAYFFLSRDVLIRLNMHQALIDNYLIEDGDNITIKVKYDSVYSQRIGETETYGKLKLPGYKIEFVGRGSGKFKCYQAWQSALVQVKRPKPYISVFDQNGVFNPDNSDLKIYKERISRTLHLFRSEMDRDALEICKADMVGDALSNFGRNYRPQAREIGKSKSYTAVKSGKAGGIKPEFQNIIDTLSNGLSQPSKSFSKTYATGVFNVEGTGFLLHHPSIGNRSFYDKLKSNYSGILRDHMLYLFVVDYMEMIEDPISLIKDCAATVVEKSYKESVRELSVRMKGAMAYPFSMPDQIGKRVALSDFKNKVVFVDFYFLGCHGCSHFYNDQLKDVEEHFESNDNIVFVAISADANKAIWEKSLSSGIYTNGSTPNVVNLYTDGKGFEHPMIKYYNFKSYPCPILVDKKGRIFEYNLLTDKNTLIAKINEALNEN